MRIFNTAGPCDPAKHYTLLRESLVAEGRELVEQGRYFTIFAPRQAGKTTLFQLLSRDLLQRGYAPIWISFEGLHSLTRSEFYQALTLYLRDEFAKLNIHVTQELHNQFDLQLLFREASKGAQPIVLIIDEFENIPPVVLDELMHTFRAMYQKREYHKLQSLVLVGVSTIAELVLSSASPFNIVDELRIPYFTNEEVQDLMAQHTAETGQQFASDVVKAIFENTIGQPGLVCALCHHLVTVMVPEHRQPVTIEAFYTTLHHFVTERFDKNIINIVQKAKEKREFMLRLLFGNAPIPFSVDNVDIAYLFAHGVVDNINGYVDITVPLYAKRLIAAFRPPSNGETAYYVSADDTFGDYVTPAGLNLPAMLAQYRAYIRRRGYQAFNTDQLKEGAWHYSFDGFINFFIERLGETTFVEVPSGRGRTDILILHKGRKYMIETKIFTDQYYYKQGKQQLAEYLATEEIDEGYYVVFSNKHDDGEPLELTETINGKSIHTYLILTKFERPSRQRLRRSDRPNTEGQ